MIYRLFDCEHTVMEMRILGDKPYSVLLTIYHVTHHSRESVIQKLSHPPSPSFLLLFSCVIWLKEYPHGSMQTAYAPTLTKIDQSFGCSGLKVSQSEDASTQELKGQEKSGAIPCHEELESER